MSISRQSGDRRPATRVYAMTLFESKESKFASLVRAYSTELYRYAYWLSRDRFVAEDLVQETFARAWQSWDTLRDGRAVKAWLYTIVRNEHARLYERKRPEIDDGQELDEIADACGVTVLEQIAIREALAALPQAYRDPLLLQVLGGFSCAEIGRMMEISEGAVMTRLTRARIALRRIAAGETERKVGER
jgi:RNA polymerase sigma-70 factor, ECF subfamily